jgi:hypothetical protein
LTSITDLAAFISSPSYPYYIIVSNECKQKIVAPPDKVIKMWIASDFQYSYFNEEYTYIISKLIFIFSQFSRIIKLGVLITLQLPIIQEHTLFAVLKMKFRYKIFFKCF